MTKEKYLLQLANVINKRKRIYKTIDTMSLLTGSVCKENFIELLSLLHAYKQDKQDKFGLWLLQESCKDYVKQTKDLTVYKWLSLAK